MATQVSIIRPSKRPVFTLHSTLALPFLTLSQSGINRISWFLILSNFLKMQYQLSDVGIDDADALVRQCQFPAMLQDPLRKIMFPEGNVGSSDEEEIRWTVEHLRESLGNKACFFRKVTFGSSCVGFAIWTFESGSEETRQKATSNKKRKCWNPAALDLEAWNQVSKRLREERLRVLLGKPNIWS